MNIHAERISKRFFRKSGQANFFYAVEETTFDLPEKCLTLLKGRSGSGKTTLQEMLGGLLTPCTGAVRAGDTDLYALPDADLSAFRNRHVAVIPQGKAAVPSLTILENILLPRTLYGGEQADSYRAEAETLCRFFGISSLMDSYPAELSGGELRRMSIVRALIGRPDILLADEPTGDLDDENTRLVLEALKERAEAGAAVLLVTHETIPDGYANRVFHMDTGRLEEGPASL